VENPFRPRGRGRVNGRGIFERNLEEIRFQGFDDLPELVDTTASELVGGRFVQLEGRTYGLYEGYVDRV